MSRGQPLARHSGLNVLKAGALYFVLVFAAGFVLGIIRTIWIAPHFGTRNAELMEAPVMVFRRFLLASPPKRLQRACPSTAATTRVPHAGLLSHLNCCTCF